MSESKKEKNYTTLVSASFEKTDERCSYEIPFRRWLVGEIENRRMTVAEAVTRFNFDPKSGPTLIRDWRRKYAPQMLLDLPDMTEQEKQELKKVRQQLKAAEKQLEDAKMRNIALSMLIDVAEEKLKISIRKKPGARQ